MPPIRVRRSPLTSRATSNRWASADALTASITSPTVVKALGLLLSSIRTVEPLTMTFGGAGESKLREVNSTRTPLAAAADPVETNSACRFDSPELKFVEARAEPAPRSGRTWPVVTVSAMTVVPNPRSKVVTINDETAGSSFIALTKSLAVVLKAGAMFTSMLMRWPWTLRIG